MPSRRGASSPSRQLGARMSERVDLYILHGWTYKPEPWLQVIDSLSTHHHLRAKLLYVPGLGTTSEQIYTIDDYVDWAKSELPKHAVALGHSNGGRILLNLLKREGSTYLDGLILLDSAGIYEKSHKRDLSRRLSKLFAPLKKIPVLRKLVHRLLGASDYDAAPENMKQTLSNMLDSDRILSLDGIDTPTQIIWGEDDNITPLRQGRKMQAQLKNSELTIKEGWRHSRYLVDIDGLADEIAIAYSKLKKMDPAK